MHSPWLAQPLWLGLILGVIGNVLLWCLWAWPALAAVEAYEQRNGQWYAQSTAAFNAGAINQKNLLVLSVTLNELIEQTAVQTAWAIDESGQILISAGHVTERTMALEPMQDPWVFSAAAQLQDQRVGYIRVQLEPAAVQSLYRQLVLSLVLLNGLLGGLCWYGQRLWRQGQQAQWAHIVQALQELFPAWANIPLYSPARSVQLKAHLIDSARPALTLAGQLIERLSPIDLQRYQQHLQQLVPQPGYHRACLVHWLCLNQKELTQYYSAEQLASGWQRWQEHVQQAAYLYQGQWLADADTLALGIGADEPDDRVFRAVCLAVVISQLAEQFEMGHEGPGLMLRIVISAGPVHVAVGCIHGGPQHQIVGEAKQWLPYLATLPAAADILIAEPSFQYDSIHTLVDASILQDITGVDGSQLEVWQLDGLQEQYSSLIQQQVHRLLHTATEG